MPVPFATDFFLMDGSEIADSRKVSKTLRRSVNKLGVQDALAEDTENTGDTLALYGQATTIIKKITLVIKNEASARRGRPQQAQERLIDATQQTIKVTDIISSMNAQELDAGKVVSLKKDIALYFEEVGNLSQNKNPTGPVNQNIYDALFDAADGFKVVAEQFFSQDLQGGGMYGGACGMDPCECHTTIGGSGYSPTPYKRFL
jgi:hypothetical protein